MKREDILAVYAAGPDAGVALVERLLGELQGQMTHVAELTARIGRLEVRLSQDSHNSHKPPSSDGPSKLPPGAAGVSAAAKRAAGRSAIPAPPYCKWSSLIRSCRIEPALARSVRRAWRPRPT
jgi:hypothetical protein